MNTHHNPHHYFSHSNPPTFFPTQPRKQINENTPHNLPTSRSVSQSNPPTSFPSQNHHQHHDTVRYTDATTRRRHSSSVIITPHLHQQRFRLHYSQPCRSGNKPPLSPIPHHGPNLPPHPISFGLVVMQRK
ncbi:hypothetical protein Pcinc_013916 [Petrolisthes cinctipes]|uniref:Uncharacterized protein n=1 Tax=Petrolisthes cinctipes TaxID=88211 RepID=A0AAE1FW00_PETCI|nr:hypothetical protein Pcinc_013916 [Petrolisthes cinctipes]